MKVVTYRQKTINREAYCKECKWTDTGMTANSKGRYHCKKTGHKVELFTEYFSIIKQI